MRCILLIIVLSFASCAKNAQPIPRAIPAPTQASAVTPVAQAVKDDAVKSAVIAERLENKVESLQKTSSGLRDELSLATAEASRLKQQKAASADELQTLWQTLNSTEQKAKALFEEIEQAKLAAEEQKQLRAITEKRMDELLKTAVARDNETVELRAQRDHLASELTRAEKIVEQAQADLSKAQMKAAVGSYLKGCIWFIAIVVIAVIAVKTISFFKPL